MIVFDNEKSTKPQEKPRVKMVEVFSSMSHDAVYINEKISSFFAKNPTYEYSNVIVKTLGTSTIYAFVEYYKYK